MDLLKVGTVDIVAESSIPSASAPRTKNKSDDIMSDFKNLSFKQKQRFLSEAGLPTHLPVGGNVRNNLPSDHPDAPCKLHPMGKHKNRDCRSRFAQATQVQVPPLHRVNTTAAAAVQQAMPRQYYNGPPSNPCRDCGLLHGPICYVRPPDKARDDWVPKVDDKAIWTTTTWRPLTQRRSLQITHHSATTSN